VDRSYYLPLFIITMEKVASGRAISVILVWGYLFEGGFQRLDHESFIWQERFPSPVIRYLAFGWVMLAQNAAYGFQRGVFIILQIFNTNSIKNFNEILFTSTSSDIRM